MKLMPYVLLVLLWYPSTSNGQVQNNGNLRMHAGSNVGLFGDLTNVGTLTSNLGTLHVVGTTAQVVSGNSTLEFNNLILNKASDTLKVDAELQIAGNLTFTSGMILSDQVDSATEYIHFLNAATYSGASNSSHINGVIRKTGNEAFVFPTGNSTILRPIGISAPALITDHFTAFYTESDPDGSYNRSALSVDLDHVSACEYWILNKTGGSSNVEVTLSWDTNSCGVDNLCDLQVAQWDGAQWTSSGNGGVSGTIVSGTLVSGASCSVPASVSSFGTFTLGSTTSNNPLPIELLSFTANECENAVCLEWQTASEINNDFFTLEKSIDGVAWQSFITLLGAGNSHSTINYNAIDKDPFSGLSYYRLKQTDFNGDFEYSPIVSVFLENQHDQGVTVYPNPASKYVTIKGQFIKDSPMEMYSSKGQEVTSFVKIIQRSAYNVLLDVSFLVPGIYYVKINSRYSLIIKQ